MRRRRRDTRRKRRIWKPIVMHFIVGVITLTIGFYFGKEYSNKVEGNTVSNFNDSLKKEEKNELKEDEFLILINGEHLVPEGYEVDLQEVGNGHRVDERIALPLLNMLEAAKEENISIIITSSYRTMEKQTTLYQNEVEALINQGYLEDEALLEAATVVAAPGTSEHQTGLAVDLVSEEYTELEEEQANTRGFQWLEQHCQEYGFILRYPKEKLDITGVIYEPWHFRYVGVKAATAIMESGVCLEEYLE
jgi:zinc D-Ala-D-Ala carboxypeptidase